MNYKVFLDTNVLIDVVCNREPWVKEALILIELSKRKEIELVAADFSFINIIYIVRKLFSTEDICKLILDLKKYITVVEIGDNVLSAALKAKWADIEDCIQSFIAERECTDFIITRNKKDFAQSHVNAITPKEFIGKFL